MAAVFNNDDLNLRLALPGSDHNSDHLSSSSSSQTTTTTNNNKRSSSQMDSCTTQIGEKSSDDSAPSPPKAQVVGWPPVRSYRKNNNNNNNAIIQNNNNNNNPNPAAVESSSSELGSSGMLVKVSMDGAPYLRKVDLKSYSNYLNLLKGLETMFKCSIGGVYSEREGYNGSEHVPTYEDKDGDWMLVGDVPWEMFITSCKRLRIMKGSEEAKGLACTL